MKHLLALAAIVALAFSSPAQDTQPAPDHTSFFNTVSGYFTTFNTNFDGVLDSHQFSLWSGPNFQAGAHNGTSLGLEVVVAKKFSVLSETRFSDITGGVDGQRLGVAYNVNYHDVRITGSVEGEYSFAHGRVRPVIGVGAIKLLTLHTYSGIGLFVPIEHNTQPQFQLRVGFLF